jgi:hypothetical protein
MKSIKLVGLCLVAAIAFSAITVASASATPKLKLCATAAKEPKGSAHKYKGSFKDKGCSEAEAGGKYELEEIPNNTKYTGKSKTTRFRFKNKAHRAVTVTCKKDALALEVVGSASAFEGFNAAQTIEGCTNESREACTVSPSVYGLNLVSFDAAEVAPFGIAPLEEVHVVCGSEDTLIGGYVSGTEENTSKGISVDFNVTGTGEQEKKDFYYQGQDWATVETSYLQTFNEEFEPTGEASFEGREEIGAKGVSIR